MSNHVHQRLEDDLKLIQAYDVPGVYAELVNGDIYSWNVIVLGPDDTPYEGFGFRIRLNFPENYPTKPPVATFFSKMFHPNVYTNGHIYLDVLEKEELWNPNYKPSRLMSLIQILLGRPDTTKPANFVANDLFLHNMDDFDKIVRETVIMVDRDDEESKTQNCNLDFVSQEEMEYRLKQLDLSTFVGSSSEICMFLADG